MPALSSLQPRVVPAGYARVLVTSSVESQQGSPGYMPYNAAKWSLMAFQEEWVNTHTVNAQTNIQIVTILPGTVNTSLGYTGIFGRTPYDSPALARCHHVRQSRLGFNPVCQVPQGPMDAATCQFHACKRTALAPGTLGTTQHECVAAAMAAFTCADCPEHCGTCRIRPPW